MKNVNKKVIFLCAQFMAVFYYSSGVHAGMYFDPAFLSENGGTVADLSRFTSGKQAPGNYRVDIYVNDIYVSSSDIEFRDSEKKPDAKSNDNTGLYPCLSVKWLRRFGLDTLQFPDLTSQGDNQCLNLKAIVKDATVNFDFDKLKLHISIPQAMLSNSAKGYIPPEEWDEGITAGLLNYTLTGDKTTNSRSFYLALDGGLNYGPWRLRHSGSYTHSQNGSYTKNRWNNISNYVERAIIPLKSQLVMGDTSTDGKVFDSISMRGVRLYSSESMYPDSQQGYAPTVRGIAQSKAKVVVRQNGYIIYTTYVQAGPFVINDISPASSSGDLNVSIEETGGKSQSFTIPYSTVPFLQREGRFVYDVNMGEYRSGSSDTLKPKFVDGSAIYGLTKNNTIYGGLQLSEKYKAIAAGVAQNIGHVGAVSVDITQAWSTLADKKDYTGQSLRFLYAKSLNSLGTTFQLLGYRYSTKNFYSLEDTTYKNMSGYEYDYYTDEQGNKQKVLVNYYNTRNAKKGKFQANLSQQIDDIGSFYLSATRQNYWDSDETDSAYQLGFNSNWKALSYNISWSSNKNRGSSDTNNVVALSFSVPLEFLTNNNAYRQRLRSMYSTVSMNRSSDGKNSFQTGLNGNALKDGNLQYSVSQGYNNTSHYSGSANVNHLGSYGNAGVGYSYSDSYKMLNYRFTGGLIAHHDGVTFSQPLGDTNVLVKAPGAKDVKVQNATGIKTDWRGYAVLPYTTSYRNNRIALDTKTLDDHTDLDDNVVSVVPTKGAIVAASFTAKVGYRAILTLLTQDHKKIPFASTATESVSGVTGIVDDNSQLYLTGIGRSGWVSVSWGPGSTDQCTAKFNFTELQLKNSVIQTDAICNP